MSAKRTRLPANAAPVVGEVEANLVGGESAGLLDWDRFGGLRGGGSSSKEWLFAWAPSSVGVEQVEGLGAARPGRRIAWYITDRK